MKFSISFKYSNVVFKNKETKETVSYDSKAEGNSFTFDNVDEDVVLGIVKGIKDKKASAVFSYDDLRTNFINTLARNKCKELYDKLDKGEWKVEDIAISTITLKDLEFTRPTMNARENLTVESRKVSESNEFQPGDLVDWFVPDDDERYGKDFGGEVFHGGEVYKKQGDVYEVSFGEEGLFYPQAKDLQHYDNTYPRTGHDEEFVNESEQDQFPVIFKKDRKTKEVLAFFPETAYDGSCNPGNIMCYAHVGQHDEASLEYFWECKPCSEEEYASLLTELEQIYDDVELVVKRRMAPMHMR